MLPSLRWADPEAARTWLAGLHTAIADATAAAEDQLRPLRQRRLGHLEAERILREASTAIQHALSFAERGLPSTPAKH